MAQKLSLAKKVVNFLQQNPEQKFIYTEIAPSVHETYLDEYHQKPLQQLANEISRLLPRLPEDYPKVKIIESRPRQCYFTESTDLTSDETDRAEDSEDSPVSKEKEHDLYPILSEFLLLDKIYSRRIDEKRSHNTRGSGGNKWLYPDLVGVEYLSLDWDPEIKYCVGERTKLWSFEVKREILRRNVREAFFQAVSNSSWANFGYLVASEIKDPKYTLPELRMLANLHGIGFIRLEAEAPVESQIMIPAKERSEIDWDTANRLTKANHDFKEYIELIRQFYQSGVMHESDWYMSTDEN